MKSLPARPSLESLRKQAKKLARDRSLSVRDAQLALAREYGYPGWQDLTAEVSKRLGTDFEWAVAQTRRAIHDNDIERLKQLLAEFPVLLSWQADDDHAGVLGFATGAYGDAGTPEREQWFTRMEPAELLLDAGAVVTPSVVDGILHSRARGLLELFRRKGRLPRTLKFLAALGDLEAVLAALDEERDASSVTEAFVRACAFGNAGVASNILERLIALDPELGRQVDEGPGRPAFIEFFVQQKGVAQSTEVGPWKAYVMARVSVALQNGELAEFVRMLQHERWLLGDGYVQFQGGLIANASFLNDREAFIVALLDLHPAILRRQPPPPSQAIEHALTYGNAHLIPLLTRIWPLPDDLPHAAGMGDLARVKRWFDTEGEPALGRVANHAPATSIHPREPQWGGVGVQQVLDTALAWAVINRHFDVADFLLAHGANINTNWNSHEPASILHHLVFLPNSHESMKFLVDRGIDLTIKDYRWNSTARGWAFYALKDEKMARWLEEAEREREQGAR